MAQGAGLRQVWGGLGDGANQVIGSINYLSPENRRQVVDTGDVLASVNHTWFYTTATILND